MNRNNIVLLSDDIISVVPLSKPKGTFHIIDQDRERMKDRMNKLNRIRKNIIKNKRQKIWKRLQSIIYG
jgi:hypothetical protein